MTTENRDYNVPEPGTENWHEPVNQNWHLIDADVQQALEMAQQALDATNTSGDDTSDGDTSDGVSRITVDGDLTLAAAAATLADGASMETLNSGYNGDGYINFGSTSSATWPLHVESAGEYGFDIRYALGAPSARTGALNVGGTSQQVTAEPTGSWSTWSTLRVTTDLPEGDVDLTLQSTGDDWADVDNVGLVQDPASGGGSSGGTQPDTSGFAWEETHVDTSWVQAAEGNWTIERVTTLDPYGSGSLGRALANAENNDNTLVVFEVGGVIDHGGDVWMRSRGDNVYIAGQTAPYPGITLVRGGIRIHGDNHIMEHMTILPGDDTDEPMNADAVNSDDGIRNTLYNHCTFGWGTDVTVVFHPGCRNQAVINSINAEALNNSSHPEAPHGYAFNVRGDAGPIDYMGNLHLHNWGRNPRPNDGSVFLANNFYYNWGKGIVHGGDMSSAEMDWIDNVLEAGPDTEMDASIFDDWNPNVCWDGNVLTPSDYALGDGSVSYTNSAMNMPSGLSRDSLVSPAELEDWLVPHVGPRPADRDPHTQRLVDDFTSRSGRIIDHHDDVGGYPNYSSTIRSLSPPSSGVLDWLQRYTNEVVSSA